MIAVLKKIALGMALIVLSAAILLYSDLDSRRVAGAAKSHVMRVAIVQQTSIPALDDGIVGALAALKERGYVDGEKLELHRYNAQGDISTANAIAKEVTSGQFDLIFSASTISLQTVANANRFATPPRKHVFALVSDPYAAGIGVSRDNHFQHPPYLTGYGSLPSVEDAFRMAREMFPGLRRIGLVWDPAEANSVATTTIARAVCAKMGISLIEANAENSTAITDAVGAVISRNVNAIWVSPDLIASHGLDLIVSKARMARIPVFTSIPGNKSNGTLFELGANYFEIGHAAGLLAADILDGKDPATMPIDNMMPVQLQVNRLALKDLRERWSIPESIIARANIVEDESGRHANNPQAVAAVNGAK